MGRWSMGIHLKTPHLDLEIKIMLISDLFIHEETIPSALELLKDEILSEGVLKHPIIVDSKTNVVLDGMHRLAALRSIGCNLTPVSLVDYQNPHIKLLSWYREFAGTGPFSKLRRTITDTFSYNFSRTSLSVAKEVVNTRKALAALAHDNQAFTFQSASVRKIKKIYDEISKIEVLAQELGYALFYKTESDAISNLKAPNKAVLIVPSLVKEEVLQAALEGELFVQKTTRHVIPARPLFVNIPLSWLKQSDVEVINNQMEKYLKKKRIVQRDPGAIIHGRRYEESTYVFEDS